MEAEKDLDVVAKISELTAMGITSSGLPEKWREAVADLILQGRSVFEISEKTGINSTTLDCWVKRRNPAVKRFKEVRVVERPSFSNKIPINKKMRIEFLSGETHFTFESADKAELKKYIGRIL